MSYVTGVVLTFSVADDGDAEDGEISTATQGPFVDVNRWLAKQGFQPLALVQEHAAGTKHPEIFIAAGGYNHFPTDAFSDFFAGLAWTQPEKAILLLNSPNSESRIMRPAY